MATSKRGPASVPAQPTAAWTEWTVAVVALQEHVRVCDDCPLDSYCDEGKLLSREEVKTKWAVTHPGEAP